MADAAMHYLGRINQQRGGNLPVAIVHRRRLLLHSGRAFMLLGALVLTRRLNTTSAAAIGLLVAFLLWLLGVALAMLARGGNLPVAIVHRRRLLLHSGRAFMLLGALVLTRRLNTTSAAAIGLLVAFLLWLLGVALAMLAVARRTALPGARVRQRHRRVDGF
uniref:Uncharacterized protein n=1 Tax=Oryza punctata TaxID=4537 RepID=A0A0E0LD77_ORYPU